MRHDDLDVITRLAGVKHISEAATNTGTPRWLIPTHYHKTNFGKDTQLMMTEPGVFWHQVPNPQWNSNKDTENPYLMKRFLPPEYSSASWDDLIKVTRPGLDNRLSVDGEIDVDGKIWAYDKGTDWFNAWKSGKTKWNPEIIQRGAYASPPSVLWQEPAQTDPAAIGSNQPAASSSISTQSVPSSKINISSTQGNKPVKVGIIDDNTFARVRYLMNKNATLNVNQEK